MTSVVNKDLSFKAKDKDNNTAYDQTNWSLSRRIRT